MSITLYQNYYQLFEETTVAAGILDATNFKLEMANKSMLNLWHRPASIMGSNLLDFMPELEDQEYPELLKRVIISGKGHQEKGAMVLLDRHAKKETVYMDYSYTPISTDGRRTTAILVVATDVCEREMTRLNRQQSKLDLRAMVMSAPVPMCIYRGPEFKLETANDLMYDLWQDTRQINLAPLQHVFHNGVPYTCTLEGVTYSYTPLKTGTIAENAICVIAVRN